jgi:hypothetical protein
MKLKTNNEEEYIKKNLTTILKIKGSIYDLSPSYMD